jgi:hypothetical protein
MISHWAYILVGDNDTGKTSFQRFLLEALCNLKYQKLPINIVRNIAHPRAPRHFTTLFTANRSYQEKESIYGSVSGYFKNHFKDADVCVLSSHAHTPCIADISSMIDELHGRTYNVAGVFWSNSFGKSGKEISKLSWQERLWIENPPKTGTEKIAAQIRERANMFADLLLERVKHC